KSKMSYRTRRHSATNKPLLQTKAEMRESFEKRLRTTAGATPTVAGGCRTPDFADELFLESSFASVSEAIPPPHGSGLLRLRLAKTPQISDCVLPRYSVLAPFLLASARGRPDIVASGGWRRAGPSPTRSGPEGSSRNEFRPGSSVRPPAPCFLPPDDRRRDPLPRPRPQVPAAELCRGDRAGSAGAHPVECDRDRADRPRLHPHRGARGRQDDDGADHRPGAQLRRAGRYR